MRDLRCGNAALQHAEKGHGHELARLRPDEEARYAHYHGACLLYTSSHKVANHVNGVEHAVHGGQLVVRRDHGGMHAYIDPILAAMGDGQKLDDVAHVASSLDIHRRDVRDAVGKDIVQGHARVEGDGGQDGDLRRRVEPCLLYTSGKHIANALKEELENSPKPTVAKFATVQKEGNREVERQVEYYNLDVIISVGYRVKSQRGVEFRRWATDVLRRYIVEGRAENAKRLAQLAQVLSLIHICTTSRRTAKP